MQIYTGVYWSAGARHGVNQDSLSLQHTALQKGECLLAVVCDGIGSLDASQEAGSYVVRHMTDWYYHEGKELFFQNSSQELILLALQRQIRLIQENLRKFQQSEKLQTGTTCSGLLLVRHRYYLFHIGDSRIYQIRKTLFPIRRKRYRTVCLTKDDKNEKGYLLKCLGMAGNDRAVLEPGKIRRNTAFLLCTDGFYYRSDGSWPGRILGPLLYDSFAGSCGGARNRTAHFREMEGWSVRQAAEEQIRRRLELLGEAAAKAGSRDNMAAVCIVCRSSHRSDR